MDLPRFQQETGPGPLFSPAKNGPAWISAGNWVGSTYFPCQKWTCLDFSRKLDRVHFFPLPKMDLPGFRQETGSGPHISPAKNGPAWISAGNWTGSTFFPCQKWTCLDFGRKLDRVHFFPLPKMDLPGFRQETGPGPLFSPAKNGPAWISAGNWTGSTFFPCQKWTCLDFGRKLDRVHFFPLPKMDLPGFRQLNWTGSTFFPCQKWTCLDFDS